jgi:hypothetical protein
MSRALIESTPEPPPTTRITAQLDVGDVLVHLGEMAIP